MKTIKTIMAIVLFAIVTVSSTTTVQAQTCRPLCISDAITGPDPITILAAAVSGDCLELTVQFSGGCVEHSICLNWNGVLAESSPPQASLYLVHDDNNDPCDNIVTRNLKFNLVDTQDPSGHTTILQISAGSQSLTRTYTY